MAADDFFSRWSQRKSQPDHAEDPAPRAVPADQAGASPGANPAQHADELPPPTIDDVAHLTNDSDFSRFVRQDVDETVKRSALRKLFSNPHFNVMDGLDIYIDDYNKFTPMTPALLASLNHAKDLLNPPGLKKNQAPEEPATDAAREAETNRHPSGSEETAAAVEQADAGQPEQQAQAGSTDAAYLPDDEKNDAASAQDAAVSRDADAMNGTQDYDKSSSQGGS